MWTKKADLPILQPGSGFSIADKGYITLGALKVNNVTSKSNQLWEFDPLLNVSTRKADFAGLWRSEQVEFSMEGKGYIGLGTDISDPLFWRDDLWSYDPAQDMWTQKADYPGVHRYNMSGAGCNGKGYVGVGFGDTKLNDLWEYDTQLNLWTRKEDIPNSGSEISFFSTNSKGYVINGGKQVFEFAPQLNTWTQKKDFPGKSNGASLGMNIGNFGYVFGGYFASSPSYIDLKDLWEYNSVNDTWASNNDFPGYERSTTIGFSIGNKLFLGSGSNQTRFLYDWWEYQVNITLPITLINFNGSLNNDNKVKLNWQTANEVNTKNFIVQKSSNGSAFSDVGTVKSLLTTGTNSYTYTDNNPFQATNYYRLKMEDNDGRFTYSNILAIKLSFNTKLTVYPNPVHNTASLLFNSIAGNKYSINITDMTGRSVKHIEGVSIIGTNSINIDVRNFSKGTYFINVNNENGRQSLKFNKQ